MGRVGDAWSQVRILLCWHLPAKCRHITDYDGNSYEMIKWIMRPISSCSLYSNMSKTTHHYIKMIQIFNVARFRWHCECFQSDCKHCMWLINGIRYCSQIPKTSLQLNGHILHVFYRCITGSCVVLINIESVKPNKSNKLFKF